MDSFNCLHTYTCVFNVRLKDVCLFASMHACLFACTFYKDVYMYGNIGVTDYFGSFINRVRNDITLLGDAYLETSDKLLVTSRLYKAYQCLLPNTEEELTLRMDVEKHRWLAQEKLRRSTSR